MYSIARGGILSSFIGISSGPQRGHGAIWWTISRVAQTELYGDGWSIWWVGYWIVQNDASECLFGRFRGRVLEVLKMRPMGGPRDDLAVESWECFKWCFNRASWVDLVVES